MKLNEVLDDVLKFNEINLVDFSQESGIEMETVLKILKGEQNPDDATIEKIAKFFGNSVDFWKQYL